jgi:CheY-like chemotaxis protein
MPCARRVARNLRVRASRLPPLGRGARTKLVLRAAWARVTWRHDGCSSGTMARILVVDHDHATVTGMQRLLRSDGHEVVPHTSSVAAVETLRREPFDVVIADLSAPRADGRARIRTMRALQPKACLVVTSSRAHEHWETLVEAGACMVADKPLDYDAVSRGVASCRLHGECSLTKTHPLVRLRVR